MKYIIILISLVLSLNLTGCSLEPNNGSPKKFYSIQEIVDWVHNNISYTSDKENYGVDDYWASPEQTLSKRKGDCECQAILVLYLVYVNLGKKGSLVCLNPYTTADLIKLHIDDGHAIVKFGRMIADSTRGEYINEEEYKYDNFIDYEIFSYEKTMSIATGNHTRPYNN
jgi:hypothetical protein